jgi:hypothetical protein
MVNGQRPGERSKPVLEAKDHPRQIQRWYERLAPVAAQARQQLEPMTPQRLARRSGCALASDGSLQMTLLWQPYRIALPGYTIQRADTGQTPTEFIQALILTYLVTADGTTPSGRWIAYRDLPDGMFYAQAFRGYAENRLARELGEDGLSTFCQRAERLGEASGKAARIEIGDAGYAFQVLPRVQIAAAYWYGDEDFPSRASILFEDTGPHYMSTDGLAVLGSQVVNALLEK